MRLAKSDEIAGDQIGMNLPWVEDGIIFRFIQDCLQACRLCPDYVERITGPFTSKAENGIPEKRSPSITGQGRLA
jgi:hypothetical protein